MNANTLWSSILQAAIQGKLTQQDPNDDPAFIPSSVKIKIDGVNIDDLPFEVPETWIFVKLGDITNFKDNTSTTAENIPNDALVVELENIEKDTGIIVSSTNPRKLKKNSNQHVFHKGCILYSKLRPYLNKVVIPDRDGFCSTELIPLYFPEQYNLHYLQHVLLSPYFVDKAMEDVYGAKMPRFNVKKGEQIQIPIPPLAEQQRIVAKLEELRPLVDAYSRYEERLSELNTLIAPLLKKSILQAAIQGNLVPQDLHDLPVQMQSTTPIIRQDNLYYEGNTQIEVPFIIPEPWRYARFKDIVSFKIGKTPSRVEKEAYWTNGTIPWVAISDFVEGGVVNTTKEKITQIAFEKCFFSSYCSKGTLLMSFKLSIGKVTIAGMDCVHNEAIISINPKEAVTKEWLMITLPFISN